MADIRCCDCGGELSEEMQRAARTLARARQEAFGEYDESLPCDACNRARIEAMDRAVHGETKEDSDG